MDSRNHINQDLYEIIEEILVRVKRRNPALPNVEKTIRTKASLKELFTAKEKLHVLKQNFMENSKKYKRKRANIKADGPFLFLLFPLFGYPLSTLIHLFTP